MWMSAYRALEASGSRVSLVYGTGEEPYEKCQNMFIFRDSDKLLGKKS